MSKNMTKCVYLPTELVAQVNEIAAAEGEAFSHIVSDALTALVLMRGTRVPVAR